MMDHVIDFKLTCQTTYPLDMKKYDCVTTFRVDGGSMHFSKLEDVAQQMAIAVQKQSDMKMAA